MELIESNGNVFRLLLRERSGTSAAFRAAVIREIRYFTMELCDYLQHANDLDGEVAYMQANAAVTIVFSAGSDALDIEDKVELGQLSKQTIQQLRFIARGAAELSDRRKALRKRK
jgi:hypothetical protein